MQLFASTSNSSGPHTKVKGRCKDGFAVRAFITAITGQGRGDQGGASGGNNSSSGNFVPGPLTQGNAQGGFPVVIAAGAAANASGDGLTTARGMSDQMIVANSNAVIAIPADAFSHTDATAVVSLQAQQTDGKPLPNWVKFDAQSGKFGVSPPLDQRDITIKVTARDGEGKEAVTTFKIKVGKKPGQAQFERPGRPGLSEQIRLASQRPAGLEHLVKSSRVIPASRIGA